MPAISRKRRSIDKNYETVPNVKQAYFPAPKRTIKEKQPQTWSAPSKYQQTITQMNPFHAIYHPDSESEALKTDEEEEPSYVPSPIGRKRRRITPEKRATTPARETRTRSSARNSVKMEPLLQGKDLKAASPRREDSARHSKPQTFSRLMPPPVTPRTWRKREIPSSQSPADSPLSTQSRRSIRDYSRSPLKERSTNATTLNGITSKGMLWARRLEVADSMGSEEEDSSLSTRRISIHGLSPVKLAPRIVQDEYEQLPPDRISSGWRSSGEVLESSQQQQSPRTTILNPINVTKIKKTVMDSDLEDDEDIGEESPDGDLGLTHAVRSANAESIDLSHGHMSKDNSPDLSALHPRFLERESSSGDQDHDEDDKEDLITPQTSRLDPNSASAQLVNDLKRTTQPGGLQTESQYENAWSSYHPAEATNPNIADLTIPSSPNLSTEDPTPSPSPSTQPPMTIPTQPLHPPFSRVVPPSQATTTDITQPSPHNTHPSSSLAFPSSPPPMPPPLSSPMAGRKAVDPWAGFEWNGVRLTDSQLLPESLMSDGFVGVPFGMGVGLSQEEVEDG